MNCIIAGASGLIGQTLVKFLIQDNNFDFITIVARSPFKDTNIKLNNLVISFEDFKSIKLPRAEVAFCTLGTTIKTAGSEEAFYKVDHDYIVNFAKASFDSGVKTFIVVSALGADSSSNIFYNKVKGQTEEDLKNIGFKNLYILRPSLLLGDRLENRPGEKIAQKLSYILAPFLVGPFKKIRPIKASQVALKMQNLAIQSTSRELGFKIISNEEI